MFVQDSKKGLSLHNSRVLSLREGFG